MLKGWFGHQFEFAQKASSEWFAEMSRDEIAGRRLMGVVDGDHSDNACADDIADLARLGAGLILVDDTEWIGTLETVSRRMAETNGYSYLNLPWVNGMAILVAKRNGC